MTSLQTQIFNDSESPKFFIFIYCSVCLSVCLSLPSSSPTISHLFLSFLLLEAVVYFPTVLQAPSLRSELQRCWSIPELRFLFQVSVGLQLVSPSFPVKWFSFLCVLSTFPLFVRIPTSNNGLGSSLMSSFQLLCYTDSESVPIQLSMRLRFECTDFWI